MKIDISGQKFTRLTVINRSNRGPGYWNCKCDCGSTTVTQSANLKNGKVKSCGCWRREMLPKINTRHGMADSPTYKSWEGMIDRCYNSKNPMFHNYGGRGIRVCKEWRKFTGFISSMGVRPSGKSLDRFPDMDGNYSPSNCRWATQREQANNMRKNRIISYLGQTMTVTEWARLIHISPQGLTYRIFVAQWPLNLALSKRSAKQGRTTTE